MKLTWACTVHKVQEINLNSGVIGFNLEHQKSFIQGKHVNHKSMYLTGTYQISAIMLNLSGKIEYVQLRGESKMASLPKRYLI